MDGPTLSKLRLGYSKHVDKFWNRHEKILHKVEGAAVYAKSPNFRVIEIQPDEVNPIEPWAYLSFGAAEMGKGPLTEFMLLSPFQEERHLATIAQVSLVHSMLPAGLSPGSTVSLGRGWREGSKLEHLLVTVPYPYGPSVENCETKAGDVKLYWLMPITSKEAAFVAKEGLEALELKFEAARADFTKVNRPSVV